MADSPGLVILLREQHHQHLLPEERTLLAQRASGMRPRAIAERAYRSERTVRAQLERVEDIVCRNAGLHRDSAVTLLWAGLHAACCLEEAFAAITVEMTGHALIP